MGLNFKAGSASAVGHTQALDADEQTDKLGESDESAQPGDKDLEVDKASVEHVESESSSHWLFFPTSSSISVHMSDELSGPSKGICSGGTGGTQAGCCSEVTS